MKSIRTLRDCAEKERQKAQIYLQQTEKERDKSRSNIDQAGRDATDQLILEYDTQAIVHEKLAQGHEQQIKRLEAEADKLVLKKIAILKAAQLHANELEEQEKALRG